MRVINLKRILTVVIAAAVVAAGSALETKSPLAAAKLPEKFSTKNSIIMLVDHQVGTLSWVKSQPQSSVITSSRVMARMALSYKMPLVLTTTMEPTVGTTIPELASIAPTEYKNRYQRGGELCCMAEPKLKAGVKALGRDHIIMAGLTTDICLFWAAEEAVRQGYKVMVVADACGTTSALGDDTTFARLRSIGVTVSVVNQMVTELVDNFGSELGKAANQIMYEEVISKLGN